MELFNVSYGTEQLCIRPKFCEDPHGIDAYEQHCLKINIKLGMVTIRNFAFSLIIGQSIEID